MRFLTLLTVILFGLTLRGELKWERLDNCRLIDSFLNDGDSFLVEQGNREFVVRLYFVDAPEVSTTYPKRVQDQADYFGISFGEVTDLGREASRFTKKFLRGRFTLLTCYEEGGGYGTRYLGIVLKDDEDLAHALVRAGLARIYGYPTPSRPPGQPDAGRYKKRLSKLEREAQSKKEGGWADSADRPAGATGTTIAEPVAQEDLSPNAFGAQTGGGIDINFADSGALMSIRGIGPVLAQRIIDARPYESVEALMRVQGIGRGSLEKFREFLYVSPATPPDYTANFYRANPGPWYHRRVPVSIQSIEVKNWPAPDGFVVLNAVTAHDGLRGGNIPVFLPEDRVDAVLARFAKADQPLISQLYFFNYQGKDIFVVRR